MCIDLNSNVLSTMPPYLVGAAPSLSADWLTNPDPDIYTSWEEFAKQLFWDYQMGEAFVLATARYATDWPARFHVVPPFLVNVEMDAGRRRYTIGARDVTDDILHIRYQGSVSDARGHGPLEVGAPRLVAASVLARYATTLVAGGGIPASVLQHPEELTALQSSNLKAQWVQARLSSIGEPAVLSGGVTWQPTQINPKDMALLELSQFTEARIAYLLGVPAFLVGLPAGGDPMTYSNVSSIIDYHWRASLRPKAQHVMPGLSGWALPRGTTVELNRDEYVQPGPLERAQTAQTLHSIVDKQGNPALTVEEIRAAERLDQTVPEDLAQGVLR
jgi:HK97 family phage portal protein